MKIGIAIVCALLPFQALAAANKLTYNFVLKESSDQIKFDESNLEGQDPNAVFSQVRRTEKSAFDVVKTPEDRRREREEEIRYRRKFHPEEDPEYREEQRRGDINYRRSWQGLPPISDSAFDQMRSARKGEGKGRGKVKGKTTKTVSRSSGSRASQSSPRRNDDDNSGSTRTRVFPNGSVAIERQQPDGSKTTTYSDGRASVTHGNIETRSDGVVGVRNGNTITYSNGQVVYDPVH